MRRLLYCCERDLERPLSFNSDATSRRRDRIVPREGRGGELSASILSGTREQAPFASDNLTVNGFDPQNVADQTSNEYCCFLLSKYCVVLTSDYCYREW